MFNIANKNKVTSLKDIDRMVGEWRATCDQRGEMAIGLYCLVSFDPKKATLTEDHHRVFGDQDTLRWMMKFLKKDLEDRMRSGRCGEQCSDKHVHD